MIHAFGFLIFSVASLFGYEVPIFSCIFIITIDQSKQTMQLEYSQLRTLKQYEEKAAQYVDSVDSATSITSKITGIRFISKEKLSVNGTTSFKVKVHYDSNKTLKKYFEIDLDNSTIYAHACEEVIVNGIQKLIPAEKYLKYSSEENILKIKYSMNTKAGEQCDMIKNPVNL